MYRRNYTKESIDNAVIDEVKRRKHIIHGAKSANLQMPEPFQRQTKDWDVWARSPREAQDKMEDYLDKVAGYDAFAETSIPLSGSNETVYRVVDRLTGHEVVDFVKTPKDAKYKLINGVRYETLDYAKKIYQNIIRNPEINYQRKMKSRRDLERILAFEASLKKGERKPTREVRDMRVPYPFMIEIKPIGVW